MLNEFSIVLPIRNRKTQSQQAIESVLRQSYSHWELIIVDDFSNDGSEKMVDEYAKNEKVKVIHLPKWGHKVVARNTGMKAATKDWICWLDCDDEYLKTYLEVLNSYMTEDYPGYKCYHFGSIVVRMGIQTIRETLDLKEEGEGMEEFKSGGIGSGSFVFHRECLKKVGYLPEAINPYLFADAAKNEHPEIMEWYGPLYMKGGKELGNPWGDDWYMFYKITRKYKSKGLPIAPYIQFVRRQKFSFQPLRDY